MSPMCGSWDGYFMRLPPQGVEALDDLLPDRWLQSHPECRWQIAHLRQAERARKTR